MLFACKLHWLILLEWENRALSLQNTQICGYRKIYHKIFQVLFLRAWLPWGPASAILVLPVCLHGYSGHAIETSLSRKMVVWYRIKGSKVCFALFKIMY